MTQKLYSFYDAMTATEAPSYREARKQLAGISQLATEIFRLSCVKHGDLNEAIIAVYLTGLYHASEILNEKEKPHG